MSEEKHQDNAWREGVKKMSEDNEWREWVKRKMKRMYEMNNEEKWR